MFFDLKAGRVAWVVTDQHGLITGADPGAQGIFDAYPGLQAFLADWSRDWQIGGEAVQFERLMPGKPAASDLRLEAVPIVSIDKLNVAGAERTAPPRLVLVGVSEAPDSLVASLRDRFALTAAELRVAVEAAEGRKPTQIAEHLGLSVHTVRSHLKRIFLKVEVHSQAEFVRATLNRRGGNSQAGT